MTSKNRIMAYLGSLQELESPPSVIRDIVSRAFREISPRENPEGRTRRNLSLTTKMLQLSEFSTDTSGTKSIAVPQTPGSARLLIISMAIYNQLHALGLAHDKSTADTWRHCLRTANIASEIASKIDETSIEAAYVAGLMHDLGILIVQKYFPHEARCIKQAVADGAPLLEAERRLLGTDHQEVGRQIAEKWVFPELLYSLIGDHHPSEEQEDEDVSALSWVLRLADIIDLEHNIGSCGSSEVAHEEGSLVKALCKIGLEKGDLFEYYSVLPRYTYDFPKNVKITAEEKACCIPNMEEGLLNLYFEMAAIFRERQILSRRLLQQQYSEGAFDSFKIMLSTISHYISNSISIIIGEGEILQQFKDAGEIDKALDHIPQVTRAIRRSSKRISILLEELSNIASLDDIQYFRSSKAIDVEKQLRERLEVEPC